MKKAMRPQRRMTAERGRPNTRAARGAPAFSILSAPPRLTSDCVSTFNGANSGGGGGGEENGGGGVDSRRSSGGRGAVWRAKARSWRVAGVSLVLLCMTVYLPGLWTIPPVDRDECRFAQASRQMFEAAALPAERLDARVDPQTGVPVGMHAGGWVVPMYGTTPRLNKPPLVYWLQVASAAVMTGGHPERDAMWMYRLPSALCALGTVLIAWRLGVRMFDPRAAWLGAVLLAVSPMIVWDAHQARSDQLLTLCTTAAMACLWGVVGGWGGRPRSALGAAGLKEAGEDARPTGTEAGGDARPPGIARQVGNLPHAVGLWVCLGLGVMTKGPITPLVVLGAVVALCVVKRGWRPLLAVRPLLGVVIVLLVAAPWVWLLSRQIGLDVYAREVWKETFLRAATGAKDGGHAFFPPGLHAALLVALFWPGCLLVFPAVGWAVGRAWGDKSKLKLKLKERQRWGLSAIWRGLGVMRGVARGREGELFLLAWVIPAWVVFELSPAKLPHYTMPLYPALALLAARYTLAAQARLKVGKALGVWGWFAIGAALPAVVAAAVWFSDIAPEGRIGAVVFIVGLVGIPVWGTLLVAVQMIRGHQWGAASVVAACAGAYALALLLHGIVPSVSRVEQPRLLTGNLTRRVFEVVRAFDPEGVRPLASVYHEDSVVFQSRGRVQKITAKDQAAWLAANPAGILIGTRDADGVGRDAVEIGPPPPPPASGENKPEPDAPAAPKKPLEGFAILAPMRMADGQLTPPPPRSSGAKQVKP